VRIKKAFKYLLERLPPPYKLIRLPTFSYKLDLCEKGELHAILERIKNAKTLGGILIEMDRLIEFNRRIEKKSGDPAYGFMASLLALLRNEASELYEAGYLK